MDSNPHQPVMNLRQALAYMQVSKAHLSNGINGKVLSVHPVRSFRVGRRVLIKREWIGDWIESSRYETVRQCYRSFMFRRQEPKDFKDWNDLLRARRGLSPVSCSQLEARPA
jgi:ABC-type sulfate transport system substrate-binding protein